MSLIPKVKCSRCDRSYSGLKNKCPYCGASRGRGGKRAYDNADLSARRMIQVLLLVALIITAISMAVLDLSGEDIPGGAGPGGPGVSQGQDPGPGENGGENGENGSDPAPPIATPPPTPEPVQVTSVGITWRGKRPGVYDFSLTLGERFELQGEIWPTDANVEIDWSTDDQTIVNFQVHPDDRNRITLETRGRGNTNIRATVGDQSQAVIVRVR